MSSAVQLIIHHHVISMLDISCSSGSLVAQSGGSLLGHEFLNVVGVQVGVQLLLLRWVVNWKELQPQKKDQTYEGLFVQM